MRSPSVLVVKSEMLHIALELAEVDHIGVVRYQATAELLDNFALRLKVPVVLVDKAVAVAVADVG